MSEQKTMTIAQAREAMAHDRQERAEACGREITDTLERHNCQLVAIPVFTPDGRIVAQPQVVANG